MPPNPSELAELSSVASSLEQLSRRITALGENAALNKRDDVASDLFAVERALHSALARLGRTVSASR